MKVFARSQRLIRYCSRNTAALNYSLCTRFNSGMAFARPQNTIRPVDCASWSRSIPPRRQFGSLPSHKVVGLPSLSPTMETGSISRWNVKEGDRFETGTSFCDVETDKATVSFDATDEGFVAKILVESGEVKIGQPIMVIVEEAQDVGAFSTFSLSNVESAPSSTPIPPPKPAAAAAAAAAAAVPEAVRSSPVTAEVRSVDRIFASPLAKKLTRDANQSLKTIHAALNGQGSGPNNRLLASDVQRGISLLASQPSVTTVPAIRQNDAESSRITPITPSVPYSDYELSATSRDLGARLAATKQTVPHYYVSVEINLKSLLEVRGKFNSHLSAGKKSTVDANLSVLDFLVKGAALAMKQVPDVNGSWMDTFVRRYDQVDINLVMGSGTNLATPVLRDVGSKGLLTVSDDIRGLENLLFSSDKATVEQFINDPSKMQMGTFSIHNLGGYGVKSAAPIVLPNQACALAFGCIVDTVVPHDGEKGWEVAPMMIATISCDHRVVDGALSAQYLAAFKQLIENPMNLML